MRGGRCLHRRHPAVLRPPGKRILSLVISSMQFFALQSSLLLLGSCSVMPTNQQYLDKQGCAGGEFGVETGRPKRCAVLGLGTN